MTATDTGMILAHGVGTRSDLPIPAWMAMWGAGLTVAVSFVALALLWRTARFVGPGSGVVLPSIILRIVDAPAFRRSLQALMLLVASLLVAVALFGPPRLNLAVWAVYITLWVGLIPASLLLGPVWQVVNPLRFAYRVLAPLAAPPRDVRKLERVGHWPAAVALTLFVWLELVYPDGAEPFTVGAFLLLYALTQLAAALWLGERWFARGDAFEVYSSLLGRLSPFGRRSDGQLALRNPLRGLACLPESSGLAAVVVVLLGSTVFDGLSRTQFWTEGPGSDNGTLSGTLGLFLSIVVVAALYVGATALNGRLAGQDPSRQPAVYAHSIVPIAAGYAIAHYFSLLLIDGQMTWILASNPFDQPGVDLFGTYGNSINYTVISTTAIAWVQVASIVVGHVVGVVLAHDRALREAPDAPAYAQLPLVLVMIGFTVAGLALLFGA